MNWIFNHKLIKSLAVTLIFFSLVFFYLFPPKISADQYELQVAPLTINNRTISFDYIDDGEILPNENLIIKTDQKTYIGLTQADVYFSMTNIGYKSELVNFQAYFPEDRGGVKKIERWTKNIAYEVDIQEYGEMSYLCEEGWQEVVEKINFENSIIFYQCSSLSETKFCDSLSEDGKNCILNKTQIGSHKETRYKNELQNIELSNSPLSIKQEFFGELVNGGINKKLIPEEFKVKKSTVQQGYIIEPNETQYFKMEIEFPLNSSGEFWIEAIGDKSGYGILDPWWNSNWTYKKQINLTAGSGAGTDYQIKLLVGESSGSSGYNFHLAGYGKSDFGDLRFTDNDESTELDYWIESISGTTPNQTATVWVEVKDNLDSNVSIYVYYGNTGATYNNSNGGSNTFIFFDDFSGDLSKWTKEKELGTITLTGGYVECGGGITSGTYGHTVLGSSATYTGFQDGIIEFKHYHAANGIGEVSYRGNYASNTGYKGRWDARSGSEQVFLKPPYSGWANIGTAITKWITASIWYKGKLVIHGSTLELYDNDSLKQSITDTTYSSAGEISLQNHYGTYTRYDDVRVRKYASTEPVFSSAGNQEIPVISIIVSDGIISYGILDVGSSTSTLSTGLNDTQTVTNNGDVTENLNIKGSNSTCWTLADTISYNEYVHEFSTSSGSSWTPLTISYQLLATNVGVSATSTFDLRITVPDDTNCFDSQDVSVTVQAVAP